MIFRLREQMVVIQFGPGFAMNWHVWRRNLFRRERESPGERVGKTGTAEQPGIARKSTWALGGAVAAAGRAIKAGFRGEKFERFDWA